LLTYVASIPLSTRTLVYLSDLLRARRNEVGSRWRRLDAGRQALLVLAHLRNGDTYSRLATGFGIGIATVYRYIRDEPRRVRWRLVGYVSASAVAGCGSR
jgi:hypothetical protein